MGEFNYRIGATDIKKLVGGSFELENKRSNQTVRFDVLPTPPGAPPITPGAEAYGVCIDGDLGVEILPAFLKIFRHEVSVRNERNQFLVAQGLATRHWIFRGVPFGFLTHRRINDIDIHGNLSFRIRDRNGVIAPSLAHLFGNDRWTYSIDERARFCGQLCCVVYALEELGLVHGDLSLGNVLIGWQEGYEGHEEVAVLVDFDGFYHPDQPLLPLKAGRHDIRKVGSMGFQDPSVLEDIQADPERACVRSDRMALGALVFQLVVWQPWMAQELRRHHLLTNEMIRGRDPEALPSKIKDIWPQGLELLEKTLAARRPEDLPGPRDWLAAIGGPDIEPPTLVVTNRRMRPAFRRVIQLRSGAGNLAKVHPDLSQVRFIRNGEGVILEFGWNAPIILSVKDQHSPTPRAPVMLKLGSSVTSNFWKLELEPNTK